MKTEDCTVYVLTWCRRDESLWGNTLVFESIRTGFPNAEIVVYDNASEEKYREPIRDKVRDVGGEFRTIDDEIAHGDFLRQRIMDCEANQVCFVDPDVVFWDEIQPLPHRAFIGGRRLPAFADPYSKTLTWERLHTSMLQLANLAEVREWIEHIEYEMFEFDAIQPRMYFRQGVWERYDTTASLYHCLLHSKPDVVFEFGDAELDRYDHLFCGTHLWDIAAESSELAALLQQVHEAAKSDLSSIKGLWRQQQALFEEFAKG
jgi:hypothetical protein